MHMKGTSETCRNERHTSIKLANLVANCTYAMCVSIQNHTHLRIWTRKLNPSIHFHAAYLVQDHWGGWYYNGCSCTECIWSVLCSKTGTDPEPLDDSASATGYKPREAVLATEPPLRCDVVAWLQWPGPCITFKPDWTDSLCFHNFSVTLPSWDHL